MGAAACGWVVAVGMAGWLSSVAAEAARVWVIGAPLSPAAALTGVAAAAATAGLAWLALGVVLEVVARAPGAVGRGAAALSAAVSPRVVRRAAAVLLGVGVGAGVAVGPAAAGPARGAAASAWAAAAPAPPALVASPAAASVSPSPQLPDPAWAPLPDPGWVPDAPRVRPQPDVATVSTLGRRTVAQGTGEVVVVRGDSLWTIAARHLGPGAGDREVAAEWPRWYAANRDVIGEDPDVLLPGQVLRPPGPEEPR